jgi:hypothetical protein
LSLSCKIRTTHYSALILKYEAQCEYAALCHSVSELQDTHFRALILKYGSHIEPLFVYRMMERVSSLPNFRSLGIYYNWRIHKIKWLFSFSLHRSRMLKLV